MYIFHYETLMSFSWWNKQSQIGIRSWFENDIIGSANDADGRERRVYRDRFQPQGQVWGAEVARGGREQEAGTAAGEKVCPQEIQGKKYIIWVRKWVSQLFLCIILSSDHWEGSTYQAKSGRNREDWITQHSGRHTHITCDTCRRASVFMSFPLSLGSMMFL